MRKLQISATEIIMTGQIFLFTNHSNHLEFQNKMSDNNPLLSGS